MRTKPPKKFIFFKEEDITRLYPLGVFKVHVYLAVFMVFVTAILYFFGE